ncbi:MAG TPA: flagellar protein FliT [Clostridium sp.]|nr:flagellar protein FliT [Clostridium sp.]
MNIDIFEEYRMININIISSLKNDTESIELFDKREKIIEELCCMNCSIEEKKKMYNNMGLAELDKDINNLLKEKMENIKGKINHIARNKVANKSYNSVNRRTNFFSVNV